MRKPRRTSRLPALAVRIQWLTREIERLVPELRAALAEPGSPWPIAPAARELERAASALASLAGRQPQPPLPPGVQDLLEGTSPLLSIFGSRLILSGAAGGPRRPPSAAARALAVLLEYPDRDLHAADVAARLGCSVPSARTTLNRLVRSGHAIRSAPGRFRARES